MRNQAIAFALLALLSSSALGQASYYEDFESAGNVAGGQHGPSGLIAAGWEFRNQSEPASVGTWRRWSQAYQGSWGLYVDTTVGWWQGVQSQASSWALLPTVAGQAADDELRFFFRCNARIQSGADPALVVGQDAYAQYWYRDPQSPSTTGLSNALAFTIEP